MLETNELDPEMEGLVKLYKKQIEPEEFFKGWTDEQFLEWLAKGTSKQRKNITRKLGEAGMYRLAILARDFKPEQFSVYEEE